MARLILLDLMHLVHTLALLTVPLSLILTVWMFAFHFLLVCLFEWDTLFPETCPFPQISHFLDIYRTSFNIIKHVAFFQNIFNIFLFVQSNKRYYIILSIRFTSIFSIICLEIFCEGRFSPPPGFFHVDDPLITAASEGQSQISFNGLVSSVN